jgi:hypothetical protein
VRTWTDRQIAIGNLWRDEIDTALARADAAIFLLCPDFLASDFCMGVELPLLLQRHADVGVLILFVLTDDCGWKEMDFIARYQMVPRDAKPIRAFHRHSLAYTRVAQEIGETLIGSSRLPIPDSDSGICDGPAFAQVQLHTLPADGARTLLRDRGLAGSDDDLDRLAERCAVTDRWPGAGTWIPLRSIQATGLRAHRTGRRGPRAGGHGPACRDHAWRHSPQRPGGRRTPVCSTGSGRCRGRSSRTGWMDWNRSTERWGMGVGRGCTRRRGGS